MEINFPLIKLRDYQQEPWDKIFVEGVKKLSLEWHRRCGKDLFCLNAQIAYAMLNKGNHWYILPETQQVRNSIWEGITSEGTKYLDFIPQELIHKVDNQSMKIYLKDPDCPTKSGSIISFLGGDRYDKRVGAGLKSCVISENSLQKPNLYNLAIEPILKETDGLIMFNFTPRGSNHATIMHDFLMNHPDYYASTLTIRDTGIVDEADLAEERERGKPEELIQQEYYCSREGANFGSYYGDMLNQYKAHIGNYSYDSGYPVHTLWDLGISDQMAIWFIQFIGRDIYVIDYYENSNYALGHYASVLLGKGYMYAMHHLPHDGNQRQMTSDERAATIQQQLKNLGVSPIKIHPKRMDIYGAIQRVRTFLSRTYFNDSKEVMEGHEALKQYQREWDEGRQVFRNTPLHNWCCLIAGTPIEMDRGIKNIEDINIGDKVRLSDKVTSLVTRAGYVKDSETIEFTLRNNRRIECSPEHKMFTTRGLVRADNLCYSDIISTREMPIWTQLLLTSTKLQEEVILITKELGIGCGSSVVSILLRLVVSYLCCTGSCIGVVAINLKRTLWMAISQTLSLQTGQREQGTQGEAVATESLNCSTIELSMKQKKGIGSQSNTGSCTDTCGLSIMDQSQKDISSTIKTETKKTTVSKISNYLRLLTIQSYMRKQMSGLEAKKTKTNYDKLTVNGGQIIEIERKKKLQPVYDITVEGHHCYFANGLLTSNSHGADAFSILPMVESQATRKASVGARPYQGSIRIKI